MNTLIIEPGIYDIPATRYHQDPVVEPSLSNSIAKRLINDSPFHAAVRHPRIATAPIVERKTKFDLGGAAHTLLLRDGRKFAVVDADTWQTKAAKEEKAAAYDADLIPILSKDFDRTYQMAEACRMQLKEHEIGDVLAEGTGKGEQTIVWQEGDVWCRSLLDWLPDDRREGMTVYDYKTTGASAHPSLWSMRTGPGIGFDFQNAFYLRGLRKVLGLRNIKMRFIVQENKAPFCLSVIEITETARNKSMPRVQEAVALWRQCLSSRSWPGYPGKVIEVSPTPRYTPDPEELELDRGY